MRTFHKIWSTDSYPPFIWPLIYFYGYNPNLPLGTDVRRSGRRRVSSVVINAWIKQIFNKRLSSLTERRNARHLLKEKWNHYDGGTLTNFIIVFSLLFVRCVEFICNFMRINGSSSEFRDGKMEHSKIQRCDLKGRRYRCVFIYLSTFDGTSLPLNNYIVRCNVTATAAPGSTYKLFTEMCAQFFTHNESSFALLFIILKIFHNHLYDAPSYSILIPTPIWIIIIIFRGRLLYAASTVRLN